MVRVQRTSDGQVRGYAVGLPTDVTARGTPVLYSGSKLARDLTWPKLLERWASTPTHEPVRASAHRDRPSHTRRPPRGPRRGGRGGQPRRRDAPRRPRRRRRHRPCRRRSSCHVVRGQGRPRAGRAQRGARHLRPRRPDTRTSASRRIWGRWLANCGGPPATSPALVSCPGAGTRSSRPRRCWSRWRLWSPRSARGTRCAGVSIKPPPHTVPRTRSPQIRQEGRPDPVSARNLSQPGREQCTRPRLFTAVGSRLHPDRHRIDVDHADGLGRDRRRARFVRLAEWWACGTDLYGVRDWSDFGPVGRWAGVRSAPRGGPPGRGRTGPVRPDASPDRTRCRPRPQFESGAHTVTAAVCAYRVLTEGQSTVDAHPS